MKYMIGNKRFLAIGCQMLQKVRLVDCYRMLSNDHKNIFN